MATISGTVLDVNSNGVSRLVRVHQRDTGGVLGETYSSPVNGTYSITLAYAGEVYVVLMDDAAGTVENDQILRTTPV